MYHSCCKAGSKFIKASEGVKKKKEMENLSLDNKTAEFIIEAFVSHAI